MKKIDVEELKKNQIYVLDCVVNFCKVNHLRYFLAYGTLLGAVRHKGYIPWDDDIDIMMPRPDYEYLLQHFNAFGGRYQVSHHSFDKTYPLPYAKVYDSNTVLKENVSVKFNIGINIDVFPLDGLPQKQHDAISHLAYIIKLRHICALKLENLSTNLNFIRRFLLVIRQQCLKLLPLNCLNERIDKKAKQFPYESSKYVAVSVFPFAQTESMDKVIFEESVDLEFEGKKYCAPKRFHDYLTINYGDYMKFPPIEEQVTHHNFEAYYKNE